MAGSPILLDTSLIVAASVRLHPDYELARDYIEQLNAKEIPTCLSPQVCREFLVVLTRQAVAGQSFSVSEAFSALSEWSSVSELLEEDERTVEELHRLVQRYQVRGKQIHDCNLVAVAIRHGIKSLATRNPDDFKRYDAEIGVEPVIS